MAGLQPFDFNNSQPTKQYRFKIISTATQDEKAHAHKTAGFIMVEEIRGSMDISTTNAIIAAKLRLLPYVVELGESNIIY